MITYNTDGVKMPSIKKRENTAWVKAVAASYGKRVGEIAYIFVDDEKIHRGEPPVSRARFITRTSSRSITAKVT